MRTLLVDNYDSYTYNLYQLIAEIYGIEPVVIRNDEKSWPRLRLSAFDAIIISPGPGHPGSDRDFGHSRDAVRQTEIPVLGVCLGHQGIGLDSGARVIPAPRPRHGHLSRVGHTGTGLFAGLPQGFTAVRYHSLAVARPLPAVLEAIAWSEDDVIMAVARLDRPQWGVQFHPESICSERGAQLLDNFRTLAQPHRARARHAPRPSAARWPSRRTPASLASRPQLELHVQRLDYAVDTERAFVTLYGAKGRAFWLDSARVETALSRFSFLGDASGPDDETLTYRIGDDAVRVEPVQGAPYREPGTIFEALSRRAGQAVAGAAQMPFDLTGGYVGFFGYELKACLGAAAAHRAETPDSMWLRVGRLIAVDHLEQRTYVLAVTPPGAVDKAAAWAWITGTTAALRRLGRAQSDTPPDFPADGSDISGWLVRPPSQYLTDIATCQNQLRAGESYEICLTNKLRLSAPDDDLGYYLRLRRLNPAPYGALLRLDDLTVFSSSPECFLRVYRDKTVESRPIKGTAPRSADREIDEEFRQSLQSGDKTRAENLMIVDLLRNDLGRVCSIGSVHVPAFMVTESYATVHQLVSTVRGTIRDELTTLDCIQACFPGGSMTGAPKLRTMEIIDSLESEARGIYSGALGYLGLTGCADLSIVIRTAVRWRDTFSVGAGGAIVLDSDPGAEYEEMMLKARAPLRALLPEPTTLPGADGRGSPRPEHP